MDADLRIEGEMTIYRATELKASLLADPPPCRLDLAEVTDIDTTGLQLLLAAQAARARQGQALQIVQASPSLQDLLALLHLESTFGLAAGTPAADAALAAAGPA